MFGIADLARNPPTMEAYAYGEEVASKGANNVASMLLQYCCGVCHWLIDGNEGKQLTLIMDIGGGEKKPV